MTQLECRNITVGYDGNAVCSNISFMLNEGDYLCILGENGSGKSTLMKTLLGLQQPLSGSIVMSKNFKSTSIGYLPQQTMVQRDFPASVNEIVLSGCLNNSRYNFFYTKAQKRKAFRIMQRLKIYDLKHRCYRSLSGGQQQRVLLARALCAADNMLLLDEPVTGLDPSATEEMYKIIYELNRVENMSVIMISHDIKSSLIYASHVLYVADKTFFGTTEQFIKQKNAIINFRG